MLYCIGDLNVDDTEEQIRQMFGHLGGVPDTTVRISLLPYHSALVFLP